MREGMTLKVLVLLSCTLELQSGFGAANLAGAGAIAFAWNGLLTGSQGDDNRPSDSFIIPQGNGISY